MGQGDTPRTNQECALEVSQDRGPAWVTSGHGPEGERSGEPLEHPGQDMWDRGCEEAQSRGGGCLRPNEWQGSPALLRIRLRKKGAEMQGVVGRQKTKGSQYYL